MRWACRTLVCVLISASAAAYAQRLTLMYNERPPYAHRDSNGRVSGLTATPAARALERAGVEFEWKEGTVEGMLFTLKSAQAPLCLLGWYKIPAREGIGWFSAPLFQNGAPVALMRADNPRLGGERSIFALLQNPQAILLMKEGYSYGRVLDDAIARYRPRTERATGENRNMLAMIERQRADYFFLSTEEAQTVLAEFAADQSVFRVLKFADAPAGEYRRLWCSSAVPEAWRTRIDRALGEIR